MKIAVCTIALNEEQFVPRWAESCQEADYRFILDTGSTDSTTTMAGIYGVKHATQVFNPWRFDHARNTIWDHLPDDIDYVIWLDMDEVLTPGWRQALEQVPNGTTRPRYKYVWSWNEDGSEGLVYAGDKICSRHDYTWKHPVHEVLKPVGILESQSWVAGLEIHHHPDHTKSRSQYLPLLELAVQEAPHDDRNQFYLAREYFFAGNSTLAQFHFSEHYRLSEWAPERAANRRYMAKLRPNVAEQLLYQAVAEAPNRREAWVDLALLYYQRGDWAACRGVALMALRIEEKPLEYLCESTAWGSVPHDLLAIASYHLGDYDTALRHGTIAAELDNDPRLLDNLKWYSNARESR